MSPTLDELLQEGNECEDDGDYGRAQECYEQARNLYPQSFRPLVNLGNLATATGDLDRACIYYRRSIVVEPNAAGHYSLANVLVDYPDYPQAIAEYQNALGFRPNWIDAELALGNAYLLNHQYAQAEECLKKLVSDSDSPPNARALLARSIAPRSTRAAIAVLNKAPKQSAEELATRATLERILLNHEEAFDFAQRAWELELHNFDYLRFLMFQSTLTPGFDSDRFSAFLIDMLRYRYSTPERRMPFKDLSEFPRPLRIGYLSGDYKTHPIAQYAFTFFRHHDRARFHVIAISNTPTEDSITQKFRDLADEWLDVHELSDSKMLEAALSLKLDILIDLSGHTDYSRLAVVSQRIAPLQISAVGVAMTTGLPNIDCRIVDSILEAGDAQACSTEKLIYMGKSSAVYAELTAIHATLDLPADKNGHITFGYANNCAKLNRPMLELWAKLMQKVPGSRLKIIGCTNQDTRAEILHFLQDGGIESERVDIQSRITLDQYHTFFSTIDIALDPFPYTGATTTIESLLAGVPVLGKFGSRASSRGSLVILEHVGLQAFSHTDNSSLILFGVEICSDLEALRKIRKEIPTRLRQSPLMDQKKFIKSWESVIIGEYQIRARQQTERNQFEE